MDKKNTMLLTVIAVATLLVAVVGATFAYFSIVQGGASGKTETNFQGQVESTDDVGLATLAEETKNFYIYLTAADMSQANAGLEGKSYWATTQANNDQSNKSDVETYQKISTLKISGVSRTDAKYVCTSTLTIAASGTMATDGTTKGQIQTGDGVVKVKANESNDGERVHAIKFNSESNTDEFDLKDILTNGVEIPVTYELTSSSVIAETEDLSASIDAVMGIKNTNQSQNYLAGKDLTLTITNSLKSCDIVTDFGA